MNRRHFLVNGAALSAGTLASASPLSNWVVSPWAGTSFPSPPFSHKLPKTDIHYRMTSGYVEDEPVAEYTWAPEAAYEAFNDIKFGIRLHWGVYATQQIEASWPLLRMPFEKRQAYQELYRSWYPADFDAEEWMDLFEAAGARMFAFTAKHHDGFSMFNTKTRVTKRVNWLADGGPVIEDCDLPYSIMETPFRRDVVKELCAVAQRRRIKVNLYFSHPDWYDADFKPYNYHPLQVPDAAKLAVVEKNLKPEIEDPEKYFRDAGLVVVSNPTPAETERMMVRHRQQLEEILTEYGRVDMLCLDQWLGPAVWPALRETILHIRKLCPDLMIRARGIGNYGDYYTPERFVPGARENSDVPWFVIYPLASIFAYDAKAGNYKGAPWIVKNLIDSVSKGGAFMVAVGPDGSGKFHPEAVRQLRQTGDWLKVNGEGIYATRPREGELWKEGEQIRFTQTKDGRTVYAFSLTWPGEQLVLRTVNPRKKADIHLLGTATALEWRHSRAGGLVIQLPQRLRDALPGGGLVYCFRIPVG